MGKYDKAQDPTGEADKLFLLLNIANELAESNRLKRIKLRLKFYPSGKSIPLTELEDQA